MSVAPLLTTERLVLRLPEPGDLAAYTAYCASARAHFVGGPFTPAQAFDKFAAMIGHWDLRGFGRYVIVYNARPIGHVGALQTDDSAAPELTWSLWSGDVEGQGFATEAAMAVRDHLLGTAGWRALTALVLPENTASLGVAKRLGAIRCDEQHGRYPDAISFRFPTTGEVAA